MAAVTPMRSPRPSSSVRLRLSRAAAAIRLRLIAATRSRRGSIAVEFALVFVPLLAFILASLQIPIIYFESEALQSAAVRVGRQIMTGSVQQAGLTQAQFQQIVCTELNALLPCAGIMVDVEAASGFASIPTTTATLTYTNGAVANQWAFNPGGPGDVVIVRVMYNWPIFGAALLPGIANQPNNARLLVGSSVFKNEPYR